MSAQPQPQPLFIRRLDPAQDAVMYEAAYQWLANSPSWRQQTEAVFGTVDHDEYMAALTDPGRIDIGVFDHGWFVVMVTFTIRAKGIYEVHLEAAPTANSTAIITAGCLIRDQIFELYGARGVFAWTPKWHRGVIRILKAIGFQEDRVTMLKGTCRGRVIEWLRLSIGAGDGR